MAWYNPFTWGKGESGGLLDVANKTQNTEKAVNNSSKMPSLSQPSTINPENDTNQYNSYNDTNSNINSDDGYSNDPTWGPDEGTAVSDTELKTDTSWSPESVWEGDNVGESSMVNEVSDAPSDYDLMTSQFSKHWEQTPEGMEDFMDLIGHHESKNENVYQTGGGPGAGIFQYERGHGKGGDTARNRLARWYKENKMDAPDWLNQENETSSDLGFDASQLTPEQQKMLFLADKRYDETASLRPDKIQDPSQWWADEHWRGSAEDRGDRVASFESDMDSYYDDEYVNFASTEQGSDAFTRPT